MTLQEAIRLFLAAKRAAGRSERTVEWYQHELSVFVTWLQGHEGSGESWFRPETIDLFLVHERERGLSPISVDGYFRALSAFFNWLRKRKLIPKSVDLPTELVDRPKVPKREPRRVALDEYVRLLDSIPRTSWVDQRDRLIVVTLFLAGIRRSELLRLEINDYDLVRQVLIIRAGKGGDSRLVPLLPAVANEYALYMMVRPPWPGPEVFLAADGIQQVRGVLTGSGVRQRIITLCRRAEVRPLNPHAFRHGLAMYLLNHKSADMSLIQRILGHKKITTTANIYAEWDLAGIQAQYGRLMDGGEK